MSSYWPYESPVPPCSGKAQPGTVDLLKYLMLKFPTTFSMGIYSCRDSSGGGGYSVHSDGRAIDLGIPLINGGANTAVGDPVVIFLGTYAYEFGIHGQIWNRVRYDIKAPQGRVYTGPHPHHDHNHIEQRSHHATTLRYANYVEIAGSPITAPPEGSDLLPLTPTSSKENIRWLQDLLNYQVGSGEVPLTVDGVWGPSTIAMVKKKTGSLGETANQQNGSEVGYRQWNHIYAVFIRAVDDDGGTGGVTLAQVDEKIKVHAAQKASASVHPHVHGQGDTGAAK